MTNQSKLDILVIEDTKKHRESALSQLSDHTLTLAEDYDEGKKLLLANQYDVLLTDLMMPKGGMETMGDEGMKYIFDTLAFGDFLALLAAKRKVKYIGVVTDVNHHDHPISAALDPITSSSGWNLDGDNFFKLNDSKYGLFHASFIEDGKKDWKKVLEALLR